MKKTTREWVRKAEADHRAVARLAGAAQAVHDLVCFHCQQSAEKYLKALLEELALTVPKTRDLVRLGTLLLSHRPELKSVYRGLPLLTRYAVTARYPGFAATKRQAEAAIRWADRVRDTARRLLGVW
jgi:HEPN domain-containing protein